VGAQEALELGLVSRVVLASGFAGAVEQLVGELGAMPPQALKATKKLFYSLDDTNFDDGIAHAIRVNVAARSTAEFREGVRRYAPKEKS
jgi:enoyl-CoA hydratase/carnithine racemase